MLIKVLLFLFLSDYCTCSEHESPLLEAAKLLFQRDGDKEDNIGGLANSLIKGLDPSIIAGMFDQVGGGGGGDESLGSGTGPFDILTSLLPLLLQQQGHKHYDDPSLEDVQGHDQFDKITSLLPSMISQIWEAVKKTGAWGELWEKSGLGRTFGLFNGPEGQIRLEEAVRSIENHQFRKKWLKSMVSFITEYVKQLADPAMQKRYAVNTATYVNTFLISQGYKANELFVRGQPFEESLINVIDLVSKRTFGITVHSAKYIKPAVNYFNELVGVGLGKSSVSALNTREIEDKLAEMINQEVLEGILRVWHAYKYAIKQHKCDKYILCILNRPNTRNSFIIRPVVTKAASIVSAWFLSGQTGSSFLSLYDSIVEDYHCETKFPVDCMGFHQEDKILETEYAHNEL